MNTEKNYVLVESKEFEDALILHFFKEKEEMEAKVNELNDTKMKTGQRISKFATVFMKEDLYPTEIEAFKKERLKRLREDKRNGRVAGDYLLFYKIKKGTIVKQYEWVEDLEERLEKLAKQNVSDITLLHEDEGRAADYYFDKHIAKIWG